MRLLVFILGILYSIVLQKNSIQQLPRPVHYKHLPISGNADTVRLFVNKVEVLLIATKTEGIKVIVKCDKGREQRFKEPTVKIESCPKTALIADLNGDGRLDIKILFNFPGASPLASNVKRKMYLLSQPNRSYLKYSFLDFSSEPETDFNNDKIYEVVAKDLIEFKNHSYWKYELYQFPGKNINNVSLKYGYPRLVPYRYKPTNKPMDTLTDTERRQLISKYPREYDQQ